MAYVANTDDEDLTQPVKSGVDAPSGGDAANVTTAGSGGSVAAPSSTTAPAQTAVKTPSSGTFTNLNSYLNANQQGANILGDRLAGNINDATNAASTDISKQGNDFRSQVDANTTAYNSNLVNSAAQNAKDYTDNADLSKQLSGTYSGPNAFSGTAAQTATLNDVDKATQQAQLGTTEGGRTELLKQTAAAPLTHGGTALDQFLVQGTQPAISNVLNASSSAAPLAGQANDVATQGDAAAKAAAATNAATRTQALGTLSQAQKDLLSGLQTRTTQQNTAANAQNDAITAFLKSGQLIAPPTATSSTSVPDGRMTIQPVRRGNGPEGMQAYQPAASTAALAAGPITSGGPTADQAAILGKLGLTVDQYNKFVAQNLIAQAAGQAPIDLSQFYTPGQSNLGTKDVATADEAANAAALAQLTGNAGALNAGNVSAGQFDANSLASRLTAALTAAQAQYTANRPGTSTGGSTSAAGGNGTSVFGNSGSTGGGGTSGTSGSGTGTGANGAPSVGISASAAIGIAVSALSAIAAPTPAAIAALANNVVNAVTAMNAANTAVGVATTDSNPDATDADGNANGSVSDAATATDGPSGTGGAAAAAASAAASAASAAGASPAAAAAAGQAAADAAVSGADAAAAAAAGAAAAAAADGNASDSSDGATGASGSDGGGGTGSAGSGSGSGSGAGAGGGSGSDGGGGTGASGSGSGSGSSGSGGGDGGGGEKDGGFITGPGTPTSDSVPKMLSAGEYVIPADVVKAVGRDFFDRLLSVKHKRQ